MFETGLTILIIALVIDWFLGEPDFIWSKIPHPVVLFGRAISWLDKKYNTSDFSDAQRFRNGAASICGLIIGAVLIASYIDLIISYSGFLGTIVELLIVFTLIAQKSLYDHVKAVLIGFRTQGLRGGRRAVAQIVGRDVEKLNEEGVIRASIETLAENFSDGVVAPAFWYAVFGLPGIFTYKFINTADSMIAHKNKKYMQFGKVTAYLDDLANWLPARLSAFLLLVAGFFVSGKEDAMRGFEIVMKDAKKHVSPNAGWPESAMAGVLNIALGGPRVYGSESVAQDYLNEKGNKDLDREDIESALEIFMVACFALMFMAVLLALIT